MRKKYTYAENYNVAIRQPALIVNKPKYNVKLKSVTGQVHCKRKKCCAYEPFTRVGNISLQGGRVIEWGV